MTEFVEFRFQSSGYNLIDEARDEVYVNIERVVRTKPYDGMKQPTPAGGMLGVETIMVLRYRGDIARGFRWELSDRDITHVGVTDEHGTSRVPVKLSYGESKHFVLKIFIDNANL